MGLSGAKRKSTESAMYDGLEPDEKAEYDRLTTECAAILLNIGSESNMNLHYLDMTPSHRLTYMSLAADGRSEYWRLYDGLNYSKLDLTSLPSDWAAYTKLSTVNRDKYWSLDALHRPFFLSHDSIEFSSYLSLDDDEKPIFRTLDSQEHRLVYLYLGKDERIEYSRLNKELGSEFLSMPEYVASAYIKIKPDTQRDAYWLLSKDAHCRRNYCAMHNTARERLNALTDARVRTVALNLPTNERNSPSIYLDMPLESQINIAALIRDWTPGEMELYIVDETQREYMSTLSPHRRVNFAIRTALYNEEREQMAQPVDTPYFEEQFATNETDISDYNITNSEFYYEIGGTQRKEYIYLDPEQRLAFEDMTLEKRVEYMKMSVAERDNMLM